MIYFHVKSLHDESRFYSNFKQFWLAQNSFENAKMFNIYFRFQYSLFY